jgi:tetratricopeptide (TPR) repeat protein
MQESDTRRLSVAPESYDDWKSLENRFSDQEINRSHQSSFGSVNGTGKAEPASSLLSGTLPLFQCYGLAWLLSVIFPLTCGPLLQIETISFVLLVFVFVVYNLSSSFGRMALNVVLLTVAFSFPFLVYSSVTHESQNQSQANHYYEIGQYQRAIDAYRADDAKEIPSGKNWLQYGDCYFKLGQYQKAVESYKNACEVQSEKVNMERLPHLGMKSYLKEEQQNLGAAHFRLAKAYVKAGNKKQAQIYFKKAQAEGYKSTTWLNEMQQTMPATKRI